jgi:hypothetical protein
MDDHFDPYHKWLGIPPADQPPDHYRLLGLSAFEDDPTVIESSADRQMTHVRTFQTGRHGAHSQRLLNEIAAARLCLLKPEKKAEYDHQLRASRAAAAIPAPAVPLAAFPPAAPLPAAVPVTAAPAAILVVPPPRDEAAIAPVLPVVNVVPDVKHGARTAVSQAGRKPLNVPLVVTAGVLAVVAGLLILNRQRRPEPPRVIVSLPAAGEQTSTGGANVAAGEDRVDGPARRESADDQGTVPSAAAGNARGSTASSSPPGRSVESRAPTVAPSPPRPRTVETRPPPTTPSSKPTLPSSNSPSSAPSPARSTRSAPSVTLPATTPASPTRKETGPKRPRNVHKDAIEYSGNWYLFSNEKVGFAEAVANAQRLKARLVVISTPEENAFIQSKVKGPTFLGVVKRGEQWMNALEKPQTYFNWDRGQPQATRREVFAAIHPNGRWHDHLPEKLYFCVEWGME